MTKLQSNGPRSPTAGLAAGGRRRASILLEPWRTTRRDQRRRRAASCRNRQKHEATVWGRSRVAW
eukprot:5451588-Prymnesium_polylepis.2